MDKIHSYQELRRQVLLSKSNQDFQLQHCMNLLWYNLLVADDKTWRLRWSHNLSGDCRTRILIYLHYR